MMEEMRFLIKQLSVKSFSVNKKVFDLCLKILIPILKNILLTRTA